MIRLFETHKVRAYQELTGKLWDFCPCQGEYAGNHDQVMTPSCWESLPDFADYQGEADYTTRFHAGGNLRLEFKGVSHTATVFLDGKEIASHYNAYTGFDSIVTNLPEGEHTLTVRADNRFSERSALHIPNDYMSYGGVSRPVALEQLGAVYIQWIHVTPCYENGQWTADIEVLVKNISSEAVTFDLSAETAGEMVVWEQTVLKGGTEILLSRKQTFDHVKEWSSETPALYEISCRILVEGEAVDDLIDRFGFRRILVQGKQLLLNGRPLRIKGFCRHEDHPQFGCSLPLEAMAADLEGIRHLGANSIRTSHYPNDERFLDLCDEQGILVWEENHARGLSEERMKNPNFEPQAERVITEMISAHYNHPAIYIWGILNECASETEYGKECYRRQFELIRSLDASRPCSFASCKFKTDLSLGLPDVVSYNIYPMWYLKTSAAEYLDELYTWVQKETEGAGKPFLITEIGAGGIYGYRNSYDGKWTEEYQAKTLKKQLEAVLTYPDCMGVYIWQFCDVRVSEEWFGSRPRTMNNKGVVDEYRRRKQSYETVREIYHSYGNYFE